MGVQERRAREREARRKAVLDAARELVREHGYNGTTTKQIAAAAELSEATLFWYFRSKDEIFTSLLFEAIDFMQQRIEALGTSHRDQVTAAGGPPARAVPDSPAAAGAAPGDSAWPGTSDPVALLTGIWEIFTELRAGYPEYFQVFTSLASPEATAAVSAEVKAELVRRSGENFRRVSELVGSAIAEPRLGLNGRSDREPGAATAGRVDDADGADAAAVRPGAAWTRIATDVLWASFVGLGVLHDSRVNLGAPAHPTSSELNQALALLLSGLAGPSADRSRDRESDSAAPDSTASDEHPRR